MSQFKWIFKNINTGAVFQSEVDAIGWTDLGTKIYRSDKYHGIFLEPSLKQLTFLPDGGGMEFIDGVLATEDINGAIEVTILEQDDSSSTYEVLLVAALNLASINRLHDRITVAIEHSNLYQKVFAREEIDVDIESTTSIGGKPITAPSTRTMLLHSKRIFLESEMAYNNYPKKDSWQFPIDPEQYPNYRGFFCHPYTTNKTDLGAFAGSIRINNFGLTGTIGSIEDQTLLPSIYTANNQLLKYPATITYDYAFKGVFREKELGGSDTRLLGHFSLSLRWGSSIDNVAGSVALFTTSVSEHGDINVPFDVAGSATMMLNESDSVWLYWYYDTTFTTGGGVADLSLEWEYEQAYFNMHIESTTDSTPCKMQLIHEVWQQVADGVADKDGSFKSDFYGRIDSQKQSYPVDGDGSRLAITNGLNIRRIPDQKIYANIRSLFDSCHALDNVGLGIEGDKIVVEKLEHFYQHNNRIINLGQIEHIDSIVTTIDNSRYFNKVDIGYNKWETEFTGGRQEPNTKHQYSTKVNAIKGTYSKMCPYVSSSFAIELTRRKKAGNAAIYNGGDSTDWRYDKDNFIISTMSSISANAIFYTSDDGIGILHQSLAGILEVGDIITVTGSLYNNGSFTIDEIFNFGTDTMIRVVENLTNEGPVAISITRPANVIIAAEKDENFSIINNLYSADTTYNLRRTPARMLQAHMNAIVPCLQIIGGAVKFVNGDGNTMLESAMVPTGAQEDFNGQLLGENDSIAYGDSNVRNVRPLWLPLIDTFKYPLYPSQFRAIKQNPYGYVEYYHKPTEIRRGYILEADRNTSDGITQFKLLRKYGN